LARIGRSASWRRLRAVGRMAVEHKEATMPEGNGDMDEQATALPLIDPLVTSKLMDEQLALLHRHGKVLPTVAGQMLFREGDRSYDFMVILSGSVAVVDHHGGIERALATAGPREFLAELSILTGERLFTGAVVRDPGSILVVPVDVLHSLINQDQALGDLIVGTAFRRRQWLVQAQAGMTIVGSSLAVESHACACRFRKPEVTNSTTRRCLSISDASRATAGEALEAIP
jgi:thioredoxin reductase (NADPH)